MATCLALAACGGESRQSSRELASGPFDGEVAMTYVQAQLAFGARVPGTEAAVKGGDWITAQMRLRADTVVEQRWDHVTASGRRVPLRNIIARFNPCASERVLYVTHWDSRPRSESASDTARQRLPVPGANDGASGVALLVALGDLLVRSPPRIGVDLLFVDGEDYGDFGPPDVDVLLGSRYFVEHLPEPSYQPLFGVLWDMIGDRDLKIEQEANSLRAAPEVVTLVWETARSLGHGDTFLPTEGLAITDDHIPFLEKGLHVIDVIDLDYPWHHTPDDTIDKISAASLKRVGDVAWALLQR
ncbi:MAG: M28 family peptidase [Gemmatimonadaceae bacterium]|nr:M28 family peptidase [Gemmatimonadaceae bacterium]